MTTRVVRLVGDDAAIARIVSEATGLIASTGPDEWTKRVVTLARARVEELRQMARRGAQPWSAPIAEAAPRATGWWVAFWVGAAAAFVGTTVMLPPKGRGEQDPMVMMTIGQIAIVTGAAILLALAVLPLPRRVRGAKEVMGFCVVSLLFAGFAGVLTIIRQDALVEAVGATPVWVWWTGAVVLIVASVVLTLRTRAGAPPRTPAVPRGGVSYNGVTDPRQFAEGLAREVRYNPRRPGDVERAWEQILEDLSGEVDASVRDQARRLGPYAYVVWAYCDGELELPRVEALRAR